MLIRFLATIGTILAMLAGSGCGSGLLFPKGRVVKDGQPIELKARQRLEVTLVTVDPPVDMFPATVSRDGSFQVHGFKLKGIKPGKYRIGVQIQQSTLGEKDLLKGAFRPAESPIIREILTDDEEILIDVAKPTG